MRGPHQCRGSCRPNAEQTPLLNQAVLVGAIRANAANAISRRYAVMAQDTADATVPTYGHRADLLTSEWIGCGLQRPTHAGSSSRDCYQNSDEATPRCAHKSILPLAIAQQKSLTPRWLHYSSHFDKRSATRAASSTSTTSSLGYARSAPRKAASWPATSSSGCARTSGSSSSTATSPHQVCDSIAADPNRCCANYHRCRGRVRDPQGEGICRRCAELQARKRWSDTLAYNAIGGFVAGEYREWVRSSPQPASPFTTCV
jgi:hypothetical protein